MIRMVRESDMARLRELHAESGFDWPFPFPSGAMLSAYVAVDEKDSPVMLAGARKAAECFIIADPKWSTPGMRALAMKGVYEAVEGDLARRGIPEVFAAIPSKLERAFAKRLRRDFGWFQSKWSVWFGVVRKRG